MESALEWSPIAIPLGAFVAIVVGTVIVARLRSRRTRRLRTWAELNGWRLEEADTRISELARHLLPGQVGGRHREMAYDVLRGTRDGLTLYSFTYRWELPTERLQDVTAAANIKGLRAHVVAAPLDVVLPMVQVTREGVATPLARSVGGQDLQVESEAFNRAYRIEFSDERVAHAIVHPRLMEQLLRPGLLGASWRIDQGWVYAWAAGPSEPERIGPLADIVTAVHRSLPAHLLADHRTSTTADR